MCCVLRSRRRSPLKIWGWFCLEDSRVCGPTSKHILIWISSVWPFLSTLSDRTLLKGWHCFLLDAWTLRTNISCRTCVRILRYLTSIMMACLRNDLLMRAETWLFLGNFLHFILHRSFQSRTHFNHTFEFLAMNSWGELRFWLRSKQVLCGGVWIETFRIIWILRA